MNGLLVDWLNGLVVLFSFIIYSLAYGFFYDLKDNLYKHSFFLLRYLLYFLKIDIFFGYILFIYHNR